MIWGYHYFWKHPFGPLSLGELLEVRKFLPQRGMSSKTHENFCHKFATSIFLHGAFDISYDCDDQSRA